MQTLKIALVQQKAVPNSKDENLSLALKYVAQAHKMGADLVLFPEMWTNGYAPPFKGAFDDPLNPKFENERKQWLLNAIALDDKYIIKLRDIAAELNIGIVATYLASAKEKPQNNAVIIDKSGKIILEYSKVHTCDFSLETLLQSGDEFKVCEFEGVKLGVMICYDREFPESARVLMLKGAELILVPNACDMNPARINQLSTRAFENMVGVAMANYPATGWGGSCAYSPVVFNENGKYIDNIIIKAEDTAEQIIIAEFNLDEIRAYRAKETWGNTYRKPKAYSKISSII